MSDERPNDPAASPEVSGLPPGVPPPPPPKPDIVDTRGQGPTYGGGDSKKSRRARKKKKVASHPTDLLHAAPPRPARRGCCGCLVGGTVLLVLLLLAIGAFAAWFSPLRYAIQDGYQIVNLNESEAILTEAPTEPTLYIGQIILYEPPQTRFPVAFFGTEVVLSGDYWEDVSVGATRVIGSPGARFAKDLEILAFEFEDGGIELRGELRGRVMKNVP